MAKVARDSGFNWRLWLRIGLWACLFSATVIAARAVNLFVHSDSHFTLDRDAAVAANSMDFAIHGLQRASRARVVRVFERDFGGNIFDIPVDERRRKLLAVDWVERATVSRIWPNRLIVRLWERQPVAFVNLTPEGVPGRTSRLALIDAYGVILDRPERLDFSSPILSGVSESQSERERQDRVRHYLRLMNELGPLAKQLSEVDVSKPESLTVGMEIDGRAIELMMGDRNFKARLEDFLGHYAEMHKRSPNAVQFDLRLDDRITTRE